MQFLAAAATTAAAFDELLAVGLTCVRALFGSNGLAAVAILKIIGINIVLSGDNALVIALACRNLPPKQRMLGITLGAGAAIVLRVLFTLVVQQLLDVQFLKFAGGLLLLWIAVKLLAADEAGDEVAGGSTLWEAVKIVALADIVMSLDNVLAIAAAAKGDTQLIIVGLLISIPMVVFGSALIVGLLRRWPLLVWAGAGLLGWIAGELIATEPAIRAWMIELARSLGNISQPALVHGFELLGAMFVVVSGLVMRRASRAANH